MDWSQLNTAVIEEFRDNGGRVSRFVHRCVRFRELLTT